MESPRRFPDLIKGPILKAVEQYQPSEDFFYDASKLISNHPTLDTADQPQHNNDALGPSPTRISSPPGIDSPDKNQLSDHFQEPLELIPTSVALGATEHSQPSNKFLHSRPFISTLPCTNSPEHTQLGIEYRQSTELISSSICIDTTKQLHSMDKSFHRPSALNSTCLVLDLTEHTKPTEHVNGSHHIDNPDETRRNDICVQQYGKLASTPWAVAAQDITLFNDGFSPPKEPRWTSRIINTAEKESAIADFPHTCPESISTSAALDIADYPQSPNHFQQPLELLSSSQGIETPFLAETVHESVHQSPGRMVVSSLTDSLSDSQFSNSSLRQCLELIIASPNLAVSELPLPFYDSARRSLELISTSPILDTASTQPQISIGHFQQSLEVVSSSPAFNSPDNSQSSEEEEEDISPLEYARKNDLSRDYLKEPYLITNLDIFGDYQETLTDDSYLPQFDLTANVNTDESLTISEDAASLIASVAREDSSEWVDNTMFQMIRSREYKNLRQELPLLKSDHETDCKKFAQREGFEIKLTNVKLPLEMVDEENNEGLGFSFTMWRKGSESLENLKKERLEVSRDTLAYLQNILKSDWTEEDEKNLWTSVQTYKKASCS
jgi:hypothetical protein